MGFLHNKKKTTSGLALVSVSNPSISTPRERFNEKMSYENLFEEYNKSPSKKTKEKKETQPKATERRDEEPSSRSPPAAKPSSNNTIQSKSEKELDAVIASVLSNSAKSPMEEIPIKKKTKSKRHSRRQEVSESESENSLSSVSSSNSESEEETDISYEETYSGDDISDEFTNLDSFNESMAHPDHQAKVQVNEYGSVKKLRLEVLSHPPKVKSPSQVVIKIEASTITLQDCMIRRGKWYDMQSLPFVPGSDVVGTIHELGNEAKRTGGYSIGNRVAAVVPAGGNAKYITLSYENIIRVPDNVDAVTALSVSSTYVPARQALDLARKMNTPFTDANILVIGGNGPSGLATIQLAVLEGANVYTTADGRHHEYLTGLGAKCFPIDPKEWLPMLKGNMDAVIDSVCLDGFESSALALHDDGTLVCTGMSALYTQGNIPAFGLRDVRDMKAFYVKMRAKYLMPSLYYDKMERFNSAPYEYTQHFKYLCHLATTGSVKPIISVRASLNMVGFMHRAIEHGDNPYGVCVCTPWITKNDL